MILGVCGRFFAVFRLNSVFLVKNGAIWRIFWENQPKNRHMRAWFQNLGVVYPVGAKALLTEFGFRNLKGNSQGNDLKTQTKNPSCEGFGISSLVRTSQQRSKPFS